MSFEDDIRKALGTTDEEHQQLTQKKPKKKEPSALQQALNSYHETRMEVEAIKASFDMEF